MSKKIGQLHVITDTVIQQNFTHTELAKLAIRGGADTIQFRQKIRSTREHIELLKIIKLICAEHDVPLIVNDRVDLALAIDSDGVHLGQNDLPIELARRILSSKKIIGASARTTEKILHAINSGADYIGFGPIFSTRSKPDAEDPKGLQMLKEISKIVKVPLIAIGGITAETAYDVMRSGADGIAVISAACSAKDPAQATAEILAQIRRAKKDDS